MPVRPSTAPRVVNSFDNAAPGGGIITPSAKRWAGLISKCDDPAAAKVALEELAERAVLPHHSARLIETSLWAVTTETELHGAPGLLTVTQAAQALNSLASSQAVAERVEPMLAAARSNTQRALILKGLAARSHRLQPEALDELQQFAEVVAGPARDDASLLALIDVTKPRRASEERRLKNHWWQGYSHSCMPATLLLSQAVIDPVFAWRQNSPTTDLVPMRQLEADLMRLAGGTPMPRLEVGGAEGNANAAQPDHFMAQTARANGGEVVQVELPLKVPTSREVDRFEDALDEYGFAHVRLQHAERPEKAHSSLLLPAQGETGVLIDVWSGNVAQWPLRDLLDRTDPTSRAPFYFRHGIPARMNRAYFQVKPDQPPTDAAGAAGDAPKTPGAA